MPKDRGFGAYDYSDLYSVPKYVDALCGAAALIDPKVLFRRKIFVDQFFAYYEDSELSVAIARLGYKIKYMPSTVGIHNHSTATSEGSETWSTLVNRGRSIYRYMCFNEPLEKFAYESLGLINQDLAERLKVLDSQLSIIQRAKDYLLERGKLSGIYNSHWNTYGGGERHSLSIAYWLSEWYDIVLISETDFDEELLLEYYGFDFKIRKLVCCKVDTEFTSTFDIFINSTFSSSLISHAGISFYIVSFPQPNVSRKFFVELHLLAQFGIYF